MAHYYFHLRDGENVLLDPEGCSLPDPAAAAGRAMAAARSLLSADALEGRLDLDMRIDVADEAGAWSTASPSADAIEIRPRAARPAPLAA